MSVIKSEVGLLKAVDKYRMPLVEKKLRGEELTETEDIHLESLNSLMINVLPMVFRELDEHLAMRLALDYAERLRVVNMSFKNDG